MTDHTAIIADLAAKLAHPRVPAVVTIALAFEGGLTMADVAAAIELALADDHHKRVLEASHDPH